jgi:hypothetical protein
MNLTNLEYLDFIITMGYKNGKHTKILYYFMQRISIG